MSNVLDEICAKKREHVAEKKEGLPLSSLEGALALASPVRGFANALSSTNACTSTSNGRVPSWVANTTLPGLDAPRRLINMAEGLVTSFSPCSVIANTPISFTAPKRFLIARIIRKLLELSPSK